MQVLKENNFINDEKFTESFFYSEVEKKGKPLFVIKKKLQQRGIPDELLDRYVEENEESLQIGIEKGIEREIDAYKKKGVEGFDIIQKILRKGYRLQDIKTVIRRRNEEE
ncbi:RecX family transcriptional regulator [bacterium]|nr:RecX family transcriptional regulator [bacterium]